jgi:hypothetical protein
MSSVERWRMDDRGPDVAEILIEEDRRGRDTARMGAQAAGRGEGVTDCGRSRIAGLLRVAFTPEII